MPINEPFVCGTYCDSYSFGLENLSDEYVVDMNWLWAIVYNKSTVIADLFRLQYCSDWAINKQHWLVIIPEPLLDICSTSVTHL